jgi:hypothetical protein
LESHLGGFRVLPIRVSVDRRVQITDCVLPLPICHLGIRGRRPLFAWGDESGLVGEDDCLRAVM